MANTKQPDLKEFDPSDNQLHDYKKSHVKYLFIYVKLIKLFYIYRNLNN